MPQARLPDINTAYIKYRTEAIMALKGRDYNIMHGCIVAINALLPAEYQVIISSPDYDEQAKAETTYHCNHCEQDIEKEHIRVFELLPNAMQLLLHGHNTNKVWDCIKCHKLNQLDNTRISQTVLQNPTFLGVVPEPPTRTNGLMDRMRFNIEIERWGWLILGELEFKMGKFRDDNWKKGNNDDDIGQINFSLDDKESGK